MCSTCRSHTHARRKPLQDSPLKAPESPRHQYGTDRAPRRERRQCLSLDEQLHDHNGIATYSLTAHRLATRQQRPPPPDARHPTNPRLGPAPAHPRDACRPAASTTGRLRMGVVPRRLLGRARDRRLAGRVHFEGVGPGQQAPQMEGQVLLQRQPGQRRPRAESPCCAARFGEHQARLGQQRRPVHAAAAHAVPDGEGTGARAAALER